MNLLIVDDEEITREGIIQRLPWSELDINEIRQADDGINAFTLVKKFKPDIILTDVRMPRMDGIQMSTKLRELYPNCIIIFMSGYSDKEYLKAAIQLSAIDYVNKPIRIQELTSAIKNAVIRFQKTQIQEHTERVAENFMKKGIPLLRSELALSLLNKDLNAVLLIEEAKAACIELPQDGFFDTVIAKFVMNSEENLKSLPTIKSVIICSLESAYIKYKINGISAFKNGESLILHLYVRPFENYLFTEDKLCSFLMDVTTPLKNLCNFIISIGKTVQGITNIQNSYITASSGIERAFFKGYDSIIFYEKTPGSRYEFDPRLVKSFIELVDEERYEESIFFIKSLVSNLKRHENTPVNSTKNFFCSLLLELCKLAGQKGFELFEYNASENHIWQMFSKFYMLSELEELIMEKLNTFFEISKQKSKNSNIIDKIYKYIQTHYSDPDLSIDRISEYTHFSPTYICSLFKEKTDKTLNQYITEYRIEKSKELLRDLNTKVSDVALKVGCRDSGYFTKLFRKNVRITPSEYRQRLIP